MSTHASVIFSLSEFSKIQLSALDAIQFSNLQASTQALQTPSETSSTKVAIGSKSIADDVKPLADNVKSIEVKVLPENLTIR